MGGVDIEIQAEEIKWQNQGSVTWQMLLTFLQEGLFSASEKVWPIITNVSHQGMSTIVHKKMPCEIVGSDTKHQQGRLHYVQEHRGRHIRYQSV